MYLAVEADSDSLEGQDHGFTEGCDGSAVIFVTTDSVRYSEGFAM